MAAINQNFITYQGDDVQPIFTVYDSAGNVLDISTVTEITWSAKTQVADVATAITKTKSAGAITFVTNGTDGRFQVLLSAADTATLAGDYFHYAAIRDSQGSTTTVTVGRMQVGAKPAWTYNPVLLATNVVYQVRRMIGDVIFTDQKLMDEEVAFAISQRSTILGAAAECCRMIATQTARKVNVVNPGGLTTNYAAESAAYNRMANAFEARATASGAGLMGGLYAGGMSITDKTNVVANTDRVQPQFNIGMQDNVTVPGGEDFTEVPSAPAAPDGVIGW